MDDIEDIAGGSRSGPLGLHLPQERKRGPILGPREPAVGQSVRAGEQSEAGAPRGTVPGTQAIHIRTFGCSHNQSDSEYMAGQLAAYGYRLVDQPASADLWLVNTCTVKSPSQSAMETLVKRARAEGKPLVVAGCVPQGERHMAGLEGVSVVGVQQIGRVVEVVEGALAGAQVRLLARGALPSLDLPKVRKNQWVEIVPISVGCLGSCTYCKTKHARGHLGSYPIATLHLQPPGRPLAPSNGLLTLRP